MTQSASVQAYLYPGTQLCRFYHSLLKLNILDVTSDADTAEMKHFTLRNSRFEDANALYRVLVQGSLF